MEESKRNAKLHVKSETFCKNLGESKDIINHEKVIKICEVKATICRGLSTFLGVLVALILVHIVHLVHKNVGKQSAGVYLRFLEGSGTLLFI